MVRQHLVQALLVVLLLIGLFLTIAGPPKSSVAGQWKQSRYGSVCARLVCSRNYVDPGAELAFIVELRNFGRYITRFQSGFYSGMRQAYLGRAYAEEIGEMFTPENMIDLAPGETTTIPWGRKEYRKWGNYTIAGGFSRMPVNSITVWVLPWKLLSVLLSVIAGATLIGIARAGRDEVDQD